MALFPDYAPNQLALSEALLDGPGTTGAPGPRHPGPELAGVALASGEEDARQWERAPKALLDGRAPR